MSWVPNLLDVCGEQHLDDAGKDRYYCLGYKDLQLRRPSAFYDHCKQCEPAQQLLNDAGWRPRSRKRRRSGSAAEGSRATAGSLTAHGGSSNAAITQTADDAPGPQTDEHDSATVAGGEHAAPQLAAAAAAQFGTVFSDDGAIAGWPSDDDEAPVAAADDGDDGSDASDSAASEGDASSHDASSQSGDDRQHGSAAGRSPDDWSDWDEPDSDDDDAAYIGGLGGSAADGHAAGGAAAASSAADQHSSQQPDAPADSNAAGSQSGDQTAAGPSFGSRTGSGSERRTAEWFISRQNEPLYDGADMTVLQVSVLLLDMKQKHSVRACIIDELARVLATRLLPQPNVMPPSLHLLKKVVGCEAAEEYEYHMCECGRTVWKSQGRCTWEKETHHACTTCKGPRFNVRTYASGRSRITPVKRFYYFGVAKVLQRLFDDPDFCANIGRHSDIGWYAGSEADRIDRFTRLATGESQLHSATAAAYQLGIDWAQVFNFVTWSTGFLFIRCLNLPAELLNRRQLHPLLALIPGPKEPMHGQLAAIEELVRADLADAGPAPRGQGIMVTPHVRQPDGRVVAQQPIRHTVFVPNLMADTPARHKMANTLGVASYLGCGMCLFQGTKNVPLTGDAAATLLPGDNRSGIYFRGYREPVPQTIMHGGKPMLASDPKLQLTHARVKKRVQQVVDGIKDPGEVGCNGPPLFCLSADLYYTDPSTFWLVGAAHALLYGPVKALWVLAMSPVPRGCEAPWYVLSREARARIRQLGAAVTITSDFGRPYRCVVDKYGEYELDDWLHFVETFSDLVVPDELLDPRFLAMHRLLQRATCHYLRSTSTQGRYTFTEAARREAAQALWDFAKLVEEHLPARMCTANLHACAVHLQRQEQQHGAVALLTEWWVERGLQQMKAVCKYRLSQSPEVLMVNELLTRHALSKLAAQGMAATFDDLVPEYRSQPLSGPAFDSGDEHGNHLLLHAGTLLTGYSTNEQLRQQRTEELRAARAAIAGFVRIYQPDGFAADGSDVEQSRIYRHSQASRGGREIFSSRAHSRATRSGGYWVLVTFSGQQHVGEIIRFLRVLPPPQPGAAGAAQLQPLRLAICRFFNPLQQQGQVFRFNTNRAADGGRLRAVDIAQIDTALISTVDPGAGSGGGQQLRLVRYNNCSRQ